MLKCCDSICSPKASGGLGFRRMRDFNLALLSKLAWSIATNKDLLWLQILKAKYLKGKSFIHDDLSHYCASWMSTDISKCRNIVLQGANFSISINSDILIWKNP